MYHGVPIVDPYRWLEDHQSQNTRAWIDEQTLHTQTYFGALPCDDHMRQRVTELFDIGSISELRKVADRYFISKRNRGEEQPSIYLREGFDGEDRRLIDPESLGEGKNTSVTIVDVSADACLLAYGIRTGGQGARRICILDVETGITLPDELPKGALRGFSFLKNGNGFLYVTEEVGKPTQPKAAKVHRFGTDFASDKTVFYGGKSEKLRLVSGLDRDSGIAMHITIKAKQDGVFQSYFLQNLGTCGSPILTLLEETSDRYDFRIVGDSLFFATDVNSPNQRILKTPLKAPDLENAELVFPEGLQRIQSWRIFGDRLVVTTVEDLASTVRIYTLDGTLVGELATPESGSISILGGDASEFFYSFESYRRPPAVYRYLFVARSIEPFSEEEKAILSFEARRSTYAALDGTQIPVTILGKPESFERGSAPSLLTAYGAAGISLTPRYSPLASYFIELGGLFAIANLRGGGEFGEAWHQAGVRRNRPTVHSDFIAAATYLISEGLTHPAKLAIAGGSNSGLLVGVAMTQRPDLFRAVLCVAPFLDMLRYHRFDNTQFYLSQFGSSDNPEDFPILLDYSPYHNIKDGVSYPALLMVSGDADTRCDPMHARKFIARLQAAMSSFPIEEREGNPVLLDWNPLRGHFATLPLSTRIEALVHRVAFLSRQLEIEVHHA
jgi:prolyl oligopeptidase